MINLKATKKTPSITVGVNPVTNIHVTGKEATTVQYPPADPNPSEFVSVMPQPTDTDALMRENAVLRLIIEILQSNPLIVNKYVIADDELLEHMIRLLCNATEVQIDAEDVGEGCMSKAKYRKIHSIYVTVDGKTQNLKYDFPAVMKTLKDLCISTKYVF